MCLSHEDGRNCDRETTPDCRALAFRASSGLRAGAQQLLGSLHHAFRRLTRATRHQRPALHTKITTAGVCDETASTGLHVGVNDANVEACLVLRDLRKSLKTIRGSFESACQDGFDAGARTRISYCERRS